MNNSAQEIWDRISQADKVLHVQDTRFDFDALCSALFLKKLIKNEFGKDIEIIYSKQLSFDAGDIVDVTDIRQNCDVSSVDLSNYDLVTLCDSGDRNHFSAVEGYTLPEGIDSINIDHHAGNDYYGSYNYVKDYGSCCTVLYDFAKELQVTLTDEMKYLLAIGMVTDTGFLTFSTVKPEDLRMLATFIDDGLDYKEIIQKLKHAESWDEMMHKKVVYGNLRINKDKRYAYSFYDQSDLDRERIDMSKVTTRHSDLIKYLQDIDFVFVVKEDAKGKYGVSFRSADLNFSILPLAQAFGGGGHNVAAGGSLEADSVEQAVEVVVTKLEELLEK